MNVKTANKFIPKLFLELTSMTYPHGSEDIIMDKMIDLGYIPKDIEKDEHGNYIYTIGKSRSIFAAHLDTVSSKHVPVTHVIEGDTIKTDGTTTLGADDKAGVAILIWMMKHNIPGNYYFFIGEEVGCIGSGLSAKNGIFKGKYDRIISFDRRGTTSIITHQSWSRSCSDAFADGLCKELNKSGLDLAYIKDDGGVYTDSAEYVDLIPECTNVSVGYYREHTTSEHQDINHLINLSVACLGVEWENLPTERDPSVYESKSYRYSNTNWENYSSYNNGGSRTKTRTSGSWSRNGNVPKKSDFDRWYDGELDEEGNVISIHDFYDDVRNRNSNFRETKKTRRGKKSSKKGKVWFDNGSSMIEIDIKKNDEKVYDFVYEKFNNPRLRPDDLEIIRDQYLDVKHNDYDKFFYECLVEEMSDHNDKYKEYMSAT